MNTNIPLEILKALEPIRKKYENLISIVDDEYYHVVSNDYEDFYFKVLDRELSTSNRAFYNIELCPKDDKSVIKATKVTLTEDLSKSFENWIKRLIEYKELDNINVKVKKKKKEIKTENVGKKKKYRKYLTILYVIGAIASIIGVLLYFI